MSTASIYPTSEDDDMDDLIFVNESDVVDDSCPEEDDYQWCPRIVRQDGHDVSNESGDVKSHRNDVSSNSTNASNSYASDASSAAEPDEPSNEDTTNRNELPAARVLGSGVHLGMGGTAEMSRTAVKDSNQNDNGNFARNSAISSIQDYSQPIRPHCSSFSCSGCNGCYINTFLLSKHQASCGRGADTVGIDSSIEKTPCHILLTPDNTTLQCVVCQQLFLTQKVLDLHSIKHEKYERGSRAAKRFRCPECEFPMFYTSAEGLRRHREQKHQRPTTTVAMAMQAGGSDVMIQLEGRNNVTMDPSKGSDVITLSTDGRDSEGSEEKTLVGGICCAFTKNKSPNPPSPRKNIECNICGASCISMFHLRKHKRIHDKIDHTTGIIKKYQCNICSGFFGSLFALRSHYGKYHPMVKDGHKDVEIDEEKVKDKQDRIQCDICNSTFTNKAIFLAHHREHMRIDQTIGEVKKYRRKNYRDTYLQSVKDRSFHVSMFHTNLVNSPSDTTGITKLNSEKGKETETAKLSQIWSNKKQNHCFICNTNFNDTYHFDFHVRTHERIDRSTGEVKKYRCEICKETYFKTAYGLTQHKITRHKEGVLQNRKTKSPKSAFINDLKSKYDICKRCSAPLLGKTALKLHQRIHQTINKKTGKPKPFTCHRESYFEKKSGLLVHELSCQRRQSRLGDRKGDADATEIKDFHYRKQRQSSKSRKI